MNISYKPFTIPTWFLLTEMEKQMKIENLFVTWQQRSAQSNMPISVSTFASGFPVLHRCTCTLLTHSLPQCSTLKVNFHAQPVLTFFTLAGDRFGHSEAVVKTCPLLCHPTPV